MNKKFSTLMAALLLSTSVGAFAESLITNDNVEKAYDSSTEKGKGYETGKSYLLKTNDGNYVGVVLKDGKWELEKVASNDAESLTELYKILWTVTVVENNGANPQYTFVNKYTQTILAVDPDVAKSNATLVAGSDENKFDKINYEMAGAITLLQSAASYKEPGDGQHVFANIGNDEVIWLTSVSSSDDASNEGRIYVTKGTRKQYNEASGKLAITPYKMGEVVLSANDLNTILYAGLPTTEAKTTDYFDLSFDPAISSVFTDSKLQAVAVEHKELKYGKTGSNGASDYSNQAYASLVEKKDAYKNADRDYVALKNLKGEYLVVDTNYVAGTDNNANGLLKITADGLYNAKNNTRLRQPGSYLFKFTLNVTDQNVKIAVKEYVRRSKVQYGATGAATVTN